MTGFVERGSRLAAAAGQWRSFSSQCHSFLGQRKTSLLTSQCSSWSGEYYRAVSQNATTLVQPLVLDEHQLLELIFCASVTMSRETEVLLPLSFSKSKWYPGANYKHYD